MLWTEHEIATLKTMVSHGAAHSVIAKVLRRTTVAVMRKAQKLGLQIAPEHATANRARTMAEINRRPESRARVSRQTRVTTASWCPAHRVVEYNRLVKGLKFPTAEAKRIILDDEAVQSRRAAARL